MMRSLLVAGVALTVTVGPGFAQSDTLPSSGSTAGVTILGTGRSLSPAALTPTGPRTPQGSPPAWLREQEAPLLSDPQPGKRR